MDLTYLKEFLERTDFPREAREFLLPAAEQLNEKAGRSFRSLAADYPDYAREEVEEGSSYGDYLHGGRFKTM